jgi:hypothetical protein
MIATVFPMLAWYFYGDRPPLVVFSVAAALLVWWRHRSNIARLLKGEEPRIGKGGLSLRGREVLSGPGSDGTDAPQKGEEGS